MLAGMLACLTASGGSDENTPTKAPSETRAKESEKERPAVKLADWKLYSAGKYTFERHCAVCHGRKGDGHGEEEWTLAFTPRPRSFQEGLFKYRSTPWDMLPTNSDLKRTIRGGRSNTAMGMFTNLSDRELNGVIEYIKFFSKRWRDPENYADPVELAPQPDWFSNEDARKGRAESGKTLFEIACVSCHGPAGDGKGAAAPALVNAWGQKAVPADLRQPHLRSGNSADDIYRVLMTGLNGTPMLSFADAFTSEQKWELVAHVIELRRNHESIKQAAKGGGD